MNWAERLAAEWRWSDKFLLGPRTSLPLSTEVDERLALSIAIGVVRLVTLADQCERGSEEPPGGLISRLLKAPVTLSLAGSCIATFCKVRTSLLTLLLTFFPSPLFPAKPGGLPLVRVCLSPYCVVEKKEAYRLFLPALVHVDAAHLVHNLAAAVPDCAQMEWRIGSARMMLEMATLTALSGGIYGAFGFINYAAMVTLAVQILSVSSLGSVCWAMFERRVLGRSQTYFSVAAVGLSSVVFAVEVRI